MKIKELHQDIERYLNNDCYCPHEVYSFDGFICMLISPDDECNSLGTVNAPNYQEHDVICTTKTKYPQVVIFFIRDKDNVCVDALRFDATDNNLNIVNNWLKTGEITIHSRFDEYKPGSTQKEINSVLNCCDAVMVN
jgi:hypothetical protein